MNFTKLFSAFALVVLLAGSQDSRCQEIWIQAGKLVDTQNGVVTTEKTIVVSEGKVSKVLDGYPQPETDIQVINLRDHTVLPGLMDMHTHLMMQHNPKIYSERFFMNDADFALRASQYSSRTLLAGFTTVRDLGDNGVITVSLREAIKKGWVIGPRIYTSGKSLATTGGHADPTNGLKGSYRQDPGAAEGVINGKDDARKAVRERYKQGADLIKLTATGGVLSLATNGQNPQFTMEELQTIVQTAKDYGMSVAVHAHGTEGMKRAVIAGVDSIEHGTFMTEEVMDLMKKNGTYLVPTMLAGDWVARKAKEKGYFPDVVRPKAAAIGPVIQRTFAIAYARGVKIAFGTDSGVSPHGENGKEFELMVAAGMPPIKAIQSATMEAAKLLRVEDSLGSITPAKIADIVAVKGDPIENIKLLKQINFVMKDGVVYKQDNRVLPRE